MSWNAEINWGCSWEILTVTTTNAMATTLPLPLMHLGNTVHQFCSSCSPATRDPRTHWVALIASPLDSTNYTEVAENYSRYNMPRGWMLVNDGYGCGYTTQDMLIQTQKDRRVWDDCCLAELSHDRVNQVELQEDALLYVWVHSA